MLHEVENKIKQQLGLQSISLCGSGTEGFLYILKKMNLKKGEEILIPDFICEIVVIPLLIMGITFRVVDIKKDWILPNLKSYKKMYTSKTKAILLAYLWGYVHDDLEEIISWAKRKKLIIIEDIASAYGMKINNNNLGTFGDYCFGSFGHGKFINIGDYGFCSLSNSEIKKSKTNFLYCQTFNYTAVIKKIRKISNNKVRKFCFWILTKFYHLYIGEKIEVQKILVLYDNLVNFETMINQRKQNTVYVLNELKQTSSLKKIYIPNNDLQVVTRVSILSKNTELLEILKRNKCWIGRDFSCPISKLLNINTPINTKKIIDNIFNILTDTKNPTLSKTIQVVRGFD